MEISLKESDFLGSFDLLWSKDLDKYKKNKLNPVSYTHLTLPTN